MQIHSVARTSSLASRTRLAALLLLLATVGLLVATSRAAASVPSDVNWDDRFSPPGAPSATAIYASSASGTNAYFGGVFTKVGTQTMNNVALWNGRAWAALGRGVNGEVDAIAVSGSNVYVGGKFTSATQTNGTSLTVNGIARWDGKTWHALATGVDGAPVVNAIAVSGSNVYIGGQFSSVSSVATDSVARWDGGAWNPVGGGVDSDSVHDPGIVDALAVIGSDLYVGGNFWQGGNGSTGVHTGPVARWNGAAWQGLGTGVTNGGTVYVQALAVNGGDLYVGGNFTSAGGHAATAGVARWDGTAWNALSGGGVSSGGSVDAFAVNGSTLYLGGQFTTAGSVGNAGGFAEYNTASGAWSDVNPVPSGDSSTHIRTLARNPLGGVYVGGGFGTLQDRNTSADVLTVNKAARLDASGWHTLGQGVQLSTSGGTVSALATSPNGNIYAGGALTQAGDAAGSVAYWDRTRWHHIGSAATSTGLPGSGTIEAIAFSGPNVYVGGSFASIDGVPAHNIAVWNGTTWSEVGNGTDGAVEALLVNGGYLYAGGAFHTAGSQINLTTPLARWKLSSAVADPSGWETMSNQAGSGFALTGEVYALAATSRAYQGSTGPWIVAGGTISRQNPPPDTNTTCKNPADEDIYGLVVWGPAWGYQYPPGCGVAAQEPVRALAFIGSTLYVGGDFTTVGDPPATRVTTTGIARLTWGPFPATWQTVGPGVSSPGRVYTLAAQGTNLFVGGRFDTIAPQTVNNVAEWTGTAWAALGSGALNAGNPNATVTSLTAAPSGVYAGGQFDTAGAQPSQDFARWVPAPKTNLLANAGFETAGDGIHPDSWTISPADPSATRSSVVVHGGAFALRNQAGSGATYDVTQTVAVTASKPYTFTGWVSVPFSAGASLSLTPTVVWEDGVGNVLRTDVATTYTKAFGGWDQFMVQRTAPAGATQAVVRFAVANLRASAYVDDVAFGQA